MSCCIFQGPALAVCVISFLFLMQGSRNLSDWWLSHWVTEVRNPTDFKDDTSKVYVLPIRESVAYMVLVP